MDQPICDVTRRVVIDVIEGCQGPELSTWLGRQPKRWKDAVTATVTDLHDRSARPSPLISRGYGR